MFSHNRAAGSRDGRPAGPVLTKAVVECFLKKCRKWWGAFSEKLPSYVTTQKKKESEKESS